VQQRKEGYHQQATTKAELLIGLMRSVLAELPIEERQRTLAIIQRSAPDTAERLKALAAVKY
jgi:hypothetical protein